MSNGSEDTASYVDGAATANITRLHRATPPLTGTFGAEIYGSGVEGSSHRHALFLLRRKIAPSAVFHHKAKSLQWPLTDTWCTSSSSSFDRQLLLWTKMVFMRVIRQHASKHACKDNESLIIHTDGSWIQSSMVHTRQNHYVLTHCWHQNQQWWHVKHCLVRFESIK